MQLTKKYYFRNIIKHPVYFYLVTFHKLPGVLFFILACLSQPLHLIAQKTNYQIDRLSTTNGLPSNHVHCILQDYKGFIWIGTDVGLVKYDGFSFTAYKHREAEASSIGKGDVWVIYEDRFANLWIGTKGGGLNLYNRDKDSFIHYTKQRETGNSVNDNNINALVGDNHNNLWIGTGYGGLNCLNLQTKKFTYFKNNPNDSSTLGCNGVMSLHADTKNNLWVGTWGGGLNLFNYQSNKFNRYKFDYYERPNMTSNVVWTIYEDKKNNLWLGTWGSGLLLFDRNTNTFKHFEKKSSESTSISDNVVLSILEDTYGDFWVGTESGFNMMNRDKGTFTVPTVLGNGLKEDLAGSSIYSLFNDKQGILWIGTFNQGVNILDKKKQKFTIHQLDGDLHSNSVNYACEDESGDIWLGTGESGVVKYDKKLRRIISFKNNKTGLVSSFISEICNLNKDNLLFSTYKGLFQINKKNGTISLFKGKSDAFNINILSYKNRYLVLKKYNQLIQYNLKTGSFNEILKTDTFSYIQSYIVGKDSVLWIGTEESGLYKYNMRDHLFQNFRHEMSGKNFISDNNVRCMFEDNSGNIWLGTPSGLNKLNAKTGSIKIYDEHNGLDNPSIFNIIDDNFGNIWVSTETGLSRFDIQRNTFINFSEQEGLPDKTPRLFKTLKGEIILTGSKGFCIFDPPQKISKNDYKTSVIITDFKLFNKPVLPGIKGSPLKKHISETNALTLNHNQSVITFSWVGINYRMPEKNQYAFKMEGFDKSWNYVGNMRTTTYTNLNPGHYIFSVKASNNDGIWNETGTYVNINIQPPFWQTWWFRTILILSCVAGIYSWFRIRTWRLMAQKIVLTNMVNQRTADINKQKEILQSQKEALTLQANQLLEANNLLVLRGKELETAAHELKLQGAELQSQKEELMLQADSLQEVNFLLTSRGEELEIAAEQLKIQGEKLYQANEELLRLNTTKDRLFSIVAHDLKNPFNAIIGFTEALSERFDKLTSDKKHQMLDNILSSSKSAYKLLENLLEWARSQTNSVEFNPVSIEVQTIFLKIKQLLELQAKAKQIEIVIIKDRDDLYAYGDVTMIETIVRNLVSNAIKFSSRGARILLSATYVKNEILKEQNISLSQVKHPNPLYIEISVTDTGIGISPELQEKLFRIDVSHMTPGTAGETGTGLGLILCQEFAGKNSGKVLVHSVPEKGSTFSLYLPINKESADALQKVKKTIHTGNIDLLQTLPDEEIVNSENRNYQILIVEDNLEVRNFLVKNISIKYHVHEAKNGRLGWEKALQHLPDLIISDVMMPEMDGFELCKIVKEDIRTSHIPFIILTAKMGDENQLSGFKSGASDYLIKPFNISVLNLKIKNMLDLQHRMRLRYASQVFIGPSDVPISKLDEAFIKNSIEIVEKNISDPDFNVELFSKQLNMSHYQLFRKLRAIANLLPNDFIRTIRLKRAAQLIEQGQFNITEICYETGFRDPSHFTKCFKKEFGVLPKDYTHSTKLHTSIKNNLF